MSSANDVYPPMTSGGSAGQARLAMGHPEKYEFSRLAAYGMSGAAAHQDVQCTLMRVVESTVEPLEERFICGSLLGAIGDPRIRVFEPEMIPIAPAEVDVIIGSSDVELLLAEERFSGVGLRREWLQKEVPKHPVRLGRYELSKYPVTNREYAQFLKDTGSTDFPQTWTFGEFDIFKANHPVYGLSFDSAEQYCRWLSEATGRTFRLPSEEEWEYAAAGPERRAFPWGNKFESGLANTAELGLMCTSPVGIFHEGVSSFGCHDLAGNVEEFTSSDYSPYPGGVHVEDDLSRRLGSYKITRGGSFARNGDLARCARRHGPYPDQLYPVGFRLAATAD